MRNPEQTIGNLIDKQNVSFIASISAEGFPNMKAMLPPRKRAGIKEFWFTTNTSSMRVAQYRENPPHEKNVCHKNICWRLDALCIDMETAAAAHTCYLNKVPFVEIRSISDNNKESGQEAINRNYEKAAYQSYQFVYTMLHELGKENVCATGEGGK